MSVFDSLTPGYLCMLGNATSIVLDREAEGLKVGGAKQWSELDRAGAKSLAHLSGSSIVLYLSTKL